MLAVLDHEDAVDQDVEHSRREPMRLFEGGMIGDVRRIEHDDVRETAFEDTPATAERQPSLPVDVTCTASQSPSWSTFSCTA